DVAHLGRDGAVAFAVTRAGLHTAGAAAVGRVHVQHDFKGKVFLDELVDQEMAKYPPTRRLAESAWAQREHWWWVGRMIVVLTGIQAERSLPARDRATDAILVRAVAGRPAVDVVSAPAWPERPGP